MSAEETRRTEIEEKPSSSSAQASPSKVPASLASKTKDELAELLVSTLRQLKARDQRLKELNELRATMDTGQHEQLDAELAALKEKLGDMEKERAELVQQREQESKQQEASTEELSGLRKSQAKLKKAVVELRKRNESLGERHRQIDAARSAAVDELRKAEVHVAAFAEYKQKAHALLKAKDEEIKSGSEEIRESLEAELNAEKAARKKAELVRDEAVEELGKVQSQVAAQIHELELRHNDRLVRSMISALSPLLQLDVSAPRAGPLTVACSSYPCVLRPSSRRNSICNLHMRRIRPSDYNSSKFATIRLNSGTSP
jgi:chromosome segregation ATPase